MQLDLENQCPAAGGTKGEIRVDSLASIGITLLGYKRPAGRIKVHPPEFLVQEVWPDGPLPLVEENFPLLPAGEGAFLHFNLTKKNVPHPQMRNIIAAAAGVDVDRVMVGGIKDARALTAQRVSLPAEVGTQLAKNLGGLGEGLWISNWSFSDRPLTVGDHLGNQFIIFVECQVGPKLQQYVENRVNFIAKEGFWNFYGWQRFGTRLNGARIGELLAWGEFDQAETALLDGIPAGESNPSRLGQSAEADYRQILDRIGANGFYRREAEYLRARTASQSAEEAWETEACDFQRRMFVQAYHSLLFNRALSLMGASGEDFPVEIPLADGSRWARDFYRDKLNAELPDKPTPFWTRYRQTLVQTKVQTKWIRDEESGREGVWLRFQLPVGGYATMALSHIFDIPIQ